ncbi:uncharacterized protein BJ212DRAFT_1487309 [Suillus subaureus]|uniref:Uncharacterized protein n=1 Tax=Suillus subaureus TaxID=48587 RepID=A0A9P7DT85_9AGAM|nr:uncharacterized protein BJ212DRAFT_1487309 [Suillus subaureus]KAG1802507.1 hypothetical protein BJ212DRAFT_1487309 [Suillus subaureus]
MQTLAQWKLNTKTRYKIIPISGSDDRHPIIRVGGGPYQLYSPPFHTLPDLECHIAPPYVVINAGPKCVGQDLTEIARVYYQSEESTDKRNELLSQLQLLCKTWALFEGAKHAAKTWATKQRKELRFETLFSAGKRKRALTESAVLRLSRQQEVADVNMMVEDWVESGRH